MIWYTGDTHFGHTNIIKYCSRPFSSAEEMNEAIIQRWNERVKPDDKVYHLGDFAFKGGHKQHLRRLKGEIHLILGNHDKRGQFGAGDFATINDLLLVRDGTSTIILCHYGMRVWPHSHHGALHFYGHSHGGLPGTDQSCDVGVDCWDFRPVTLTEIRKRLLTLPKRKPDFS